ncbi:tRNA (adenosine(37)-N6)-dimethylallyltransferase MiaA [Alloscardovia theropitheci]|uniref:tRNA dimethylallyltransferase n=1 Tax=Alloscardovia theropitheci TaxID=2496842 RepID=A0A4R0QRA4_9BIFI|nr:tRNA (adenosine(37)-N6)-dimethylallyltransferase MiaA [Alloscardovia theropitheci]TCD54883.1 tRNA (adenosine(37)-N6)-dimethylallyltransferase MiaA [Alloscardovia theropitheci]
MIQAIDSSADYLTELYADKERVKTISIIGPTASGKTALAINLAKKLEEATGQACEIVNADAYQMYKHMDIGTAKASSDEQSQVRHHLIDIIEPSDEMSVAKFQVLARRAIFDIYSRGARPILVGGSGLYARAAIDDITFPGTDETIRKRVEERAERIGPHALFAELQEKDPQAAQRMDERNIRRTIRALEVIELTGRPFSASLPRYSYVIPTVQIGLDLDREVLDAKIDKRTQLMRQQGFENEVRALRGKLSVTAERALGYSQILSVLDGQMTADEAYADISQKTKRLARKQMGWFGRDPRVHWLDATSDSLVENAMDVVRRADAGEFDAHDTQIDSYIQHHLGNV